MAYKVECVSGTYSVYDGKIYITSFNRKENALYFVKVLNELRDKDNKGYIYKRLDY